MIKAEHKNWAVFLYRLYIDNLLKKNFNNFFIINEIKQYGSAVPLLVTPNHFSWWDGFFAEFLFRKISARKVHLMMLEEQLEKFWFFRKVGAYSIKLNSPKSTAETLKYSAGILKDSGNYVIFYPQGEIQSYGSEITIKDGLNYLLRKVDPETIIQPLAFKIAYGNEKRPDVHCRFGNCLTAGNMVSDFNLFREEFCSNIKQLDLEFEKADKINLFQR